MTPVYKIGSNVQDYQPIIDHSAFVSQFAHLSDEEQSTHLRDVSKLNLLLGARDQFKDDPVVMRKLFTACLRLKAEDCAVLDSFDDQVWEEVFENLDDPVLLGYQNMSVHTPFKIMAEHPQKERSLLRGILKNQSFLYAHRTFFDHLGGHFWKRNPMQVLRDLGADALLNFPWMINCSNQGEFLSYVHVVLPQLDMSIESDKAILFMMARSPLCGTHSRFIRDFLHRINPEQQKQIEAEDVHPCLLAPWLLSIFAAEDLYKNLLNYDETILSVYRAIEHIHFDRVFAVACKKADEEADLPEVIVNIAKTYFKNASSLGRLENPAHILRIGRMMGKKCTYYNYTLCQFMESFLKDPWNDKSELPVERIRALQQLIAEKSIVFKGEPLFNFRRMVSRNRNAYRIIAELAEKMDDPFLLIPLLCPSASSHDITGPLNEGNSTYMIEEQNFYDQLMKIFEKEPWKFALLLGIGSKFDIGTFINWDIKQGEATQFPNLRARRVLLENSEMCAKELEIDAALNDAVANHQYGNIGELFNAYPELVLNFCAPIVGPSAETMDQRLGYYSEKQLLAALSVPEGIAKLKPLRMSLLNDNRFPVEFHNWMAGVFKVGDA